MTTDIEAARKKALNTGRTVIDDRSFNALVHSKAVQSIRDFKQGVIKSYNPTLVFYELDPTNETNLIANVQELTFSQFNHPETRQKYLYFLGKKLAQENRAIVAAMLITEAWCRIFEKGEVMPEGKMVEDYEDKTEELIIQGRTLDGRTAIARFPIQRDEQENIFLGFPSIQPFSEDTQDQIKMRLLDVFFTGFLQTVVRNIEKRQSGRSAAPRRSQKPNATMIVEFKKTRRSGRTGRSSGFNPKKS